LYLLLPRGKITRVGWCLRRYPGTDFWTSSSPKKEEMK